MYFKYSFDGDLVPDWEKSKMLELRKVAVTLIKQRWQQQGIWRLCWEETLFLPALQGSRPPTKVFDEDDKWKHEFGHLSSSLRWLMDDEKTFQEGKLRGGSQEDLKQWLKQQEQELAPMTLAEYKKWTKEIEASLPLNMFLHQMNYDNKELLDAGSVGEDAVNTAAYKKTKERWERWGIWSQTWDVLPGMEWRHESLDVNLLRKGGASSDGDRPQSSGDVAVSSSSDTRDKKRKRKEAR